MIFTVIMFVSPLVNGYASLVRLDGTPGMLDHWDIWSSRDPVTCFIYMFGDIFCHQQMDRSFIINGSQMPICVRDVGMVLGFLAASVIVYIRRSIVRRNRELIIFIAVSVVLMIIDWLIQHTFSLNIPLTRMITGLLVGASAYLVLALFIDRTYEDA